MQGLENFGVEADDGPGGDVEKIMGFFDREAMGRICIKEFHRGLRVSAVCYYFYGVLGEHILLLFSVPGCLKSSLSLELSNYLPARPEIRRSSTVTGGTSWSRF